MNTRPNQAEVYRRISRRELHSSRATLAIVLATVLILACVYLGAEIVLAFLGQPPLLSNVPAMGRWIVALTSYPASAVIAIGAVLALIGVFIVVASLLGGRRARHLIVSQTTAAIVDNEVIASALARHAARAGFLDPDSVRVTVSHRSAVVHLTPTSGVSIDRSAVAEAVDEQLQSYQLTPAMHSKVVVADAGKVGT